jgi:hypothetical protein
MGAVGNETGTEKDGNGIYVRGKSRTIWRCDLKKKVLFVNSKIMVQIDR